MELSFGKTDKTWSKYKLLQAPLHFDGKPTRYKTIVKNGKLVAVVGRDYKVLPNEEAVKIADAVAGELGARPFKLRYKRSNCIYNRVKTRVYAQYLMPGSYDVAGRDRVRIGFSMANGIDGGLAFSALGFTFRKVCENGVFVGYKELARFYRKHTKGLEVDLAMIRKVVEGVVAETKRAIGVYRKLVTLELNEEIAEKIAKSRIPRKLLPDYIEIQKGKLVGFDSTKTLWDVYNSVTAAIWHNVKADIETKRNAFNQLHAIIPAVA